LFWLGAIGLGIAHAFEPDHMAAVSTFVASRPSPREAALFGFKWAVGHGLSLLLFGSLLYLLKMAANQPALFASGVLEKVVGFVLLILGLWMVLQLRAGRLTPRPLEAQMVEQQSGALLTNNAAAQVESQPHPHSSHSSHHHHRHNGSLWMGMLHGAAGTGAFIGQAAVTLSQSYMVALVYTLLFSLGVLAAMSFYARLLGGVLTWGEQRSVALLRGARWATSLATCAIGLCLINGIELPGLFDKWVH
jgi:ABC-type nickel/cobalt efflux system permease component RcnA